MAAEIFDTKAYRKLIIAGVVLAAACGGQTDPEPSVDRLTRTGRTDGQTAPAGTQVPLSPEVVVEFSDGTPAPGVTVTFAVTGGGGSITGATKVTDSRGSARVTSWILGTVAGSNTLEARVGELSTTFTANGVPGPATLLIPGAGTEQTAQAGTQVPITPEAVVTDQFGNGVIGVPVDWAVTLGGGTLMGTSPVLTLVDGTSRMQSWTLGPVPGTNEVTATVAGLGSITFQAIGTP